MNDDRWAFPPQPPAWPPAPSTTPPRRTSPILAVVAVFAATGIIAAGIGVGSVLLVRHIQGTQSTSGSPTAVPGTTGSAAEARALYQQAVASTRASPGFHYVAVTAGGEAQTIVGDAGQSGGSQAITFDSNYGAEQFALLLVGTTVYFKGNVPAIEDQLGVSAASATSVEGKWVSVVRGNGPYTVLQPGITAGSQATLTLPLTPESSARVTDAGGVTATRISGIVPATNNLPAGTGSLDIAPRTDLPIIFTSTISGGTVVLTFTTTFSAWGTAPSVSAPTGAIAWSSLTTAVPSGGYGSGGTPAGAPTPTATPGAI
ncbi:MAG: hypothetical protein WAL84_08170 [Candidatus Dormiibacterota bacterium]